MIGESKRRGGQKLTKVRERVRESEDGGEG